LPSDGGSSLLIQKEEGESRTYFFSKLARGRRFADWPGSARGKPSRNLAVEATRAPTASAERKEGPHVGREEGLAALFDHCKKKEKKEGRGGPWEKRNARCVFSHL